MSCKWPYGRLQNVVLVPSIVDGFVGLGFWLWAVASFIVNGFELGGSFTLFISLCASIVGVITVHREGKPDHQRMALAYYILVCISHTLVTVNYAVGAFFFENQTLIMYSIFAAAFWLVTGALYGFW